MLKLVPSAPFIFRVKANASASCQPIAWLQLLSAGAEMDFNLMLIQAGRHFATSMNPSVFKGSGPKREKATELAWYLIAMLEPSVVAAPAPQPMRPKKRRRRSRWKTASRYRSRWTKTYSVLRAKYSALARALSSCDAMGRSMEER